MSAAILGLLAGLATIGFSEALLRVWAAVGKLETYWKLWLAGIVLRTAWVLGMLALVVSSGWLEPRPFIVALLAGYLMAQIIEGFRYRQFVQKL